MYVFPSELTLDRALSTTSAPASSTAAPASSTAAPEQEGTNLYLLPGVCVNLSFSLSPIRGCSPPDT